MPTVIELLVKQRLQLLAIYRVRRYLHLKSDRNGLLSSVLRNWQHRLGSDISPKATIGRRLHLNHPLGIVIGEAVVIGDDFSIFHHVTLGSHGRDGETRAFPIVEDGATIYAGAVLIGGIRIGAGAVVGANSVVTIDVPPGATAVGSPARVLEPKAVKVLR